MSQGIINIAPVLTDSPSIGWVRIIHKESLPVRVINLSYIEEALLLEMTYHNKKSNSVCNISFTQPKY